MGGGSEEIVDGVRERLGREFAGGAAERVRQARSLLPRLVAAHGGAAAAQGGAPAAHGGAAVPRREVVPGVRAHLAWLARWAPAYGYGGVGSAAARCDGDLTRACLFRDRPSREDADRLDAALARMSADLAAPGDGVGILVVAPRAPEWIAGCRHVPDAGALAAALSERAWVAVLADVRAGVGPVASAIAAARDLAGSRFPVVVACGSTPSAVERMRLEVLGNRAFLPVPPPGEDVARAVWEAVRQDVATRGVAFVLDGTGVGAAAEAGRAVAAAGYLTRSFGSQDALLARWLEEVPDVVLVSAAGGDPRGLAAAADLRADPHTGPVSVLVLTDRHDRESRDAIAETGADGWIALPVVPEELDRRIRDALDRRRWLCGRLLGAGGGAGAGVEAGAGTGTGTGAGAGSGSGSGSGKGSGSGPGSGTGSGAERPRNSLVFGRRKGMRDPAFPARGDTLASGLP